MSRTSRLIDNLSTHPRRIVRWSFWVTYTTIGSSVGAFFVVSAFEGRMPPW